MTLGDRFRVYDSFLPQNEYDNLRDIVCNPEIKLTWYWQLTEPGTPFFLVSDVHKDPFYHTHLLSYIQDRLDSRVEPVRIYFNAQQPNCHGSYHEDDGDVTAILYINNDTYQPDWGGWTELYDRDTEEHHLVPPLDNRLLVFDAKLTHRGLAFLNQSDPVRTNLTYKLRFVS